MARFFADEEFPRPIVFALRSAGHDVLRVFEIGMANIGWPDEKVLVYAIAEDRIVLTRNRKHYRRLHLQYPEHSGIVICTDDTDFPGAATRILQAVEKISDPRGQMIRVYKPAR